jgi:tRNA A-37 threonylcarbamoyl transferase component Bud32
VNAASATLLGAHACLSEDEVLDFAGGRLPAELRADVHAHLDDCETCQQLLSEAVRALATAPTAGFDDDEVAWGTTFRPGTLVGQRYTITKFVARGGMGEVYEAFDQDLQERVALKTVTSTACDNPAAVRRLKAEVQLARRVSHPNVCRIYDFGTHVVPSTATQVSFLTMEFVDGLTLGQRVRKSGPLPVDEACRIAGELLLGLRAAHDAGVLHRDFKSDNVMLRKDGGKLNALILDFGLARAAEQRLEHSSSTHRGVVGTFAYIAPEQLEGSPYSPASDLYSLGIVWFEMLTGQLPFASNASPARVTLDRLTLPAPPPSSKNPLVSKQLDALVLGCLRRSPAARFQTAEEVLARLAALAAPGKTRQRSRALVPLAIVAALAGGATYVSLAGDEPAPAVTPAKRLLPAAPALASASAPAADAPERAPENESNLAQRRVPADATQRPSTQRIKKQQSPAAQVESPGAATTRPNPSAGWENPFASD